MRQGTTPTHYFTVPVEPEMIKAVEVTYRQNGVVKLTKREIDCRFEGNVIVLKLSQEDTFLFDAGVCVEIQIRVLTQGDDALASGIMRVRGKECISKAVLK